MFNPAPGSTGTPAPVQPAPASDRNCRHCLLPVPGGREDGFCCSGCATVYRLIHEAGLEQYYDLRRGQGAPPAGGERAPSHAWLEPLLPERDQEPVRLRLDLQGVHCAACVWLLEKTFLRRRGAVDLRVNPALGTADITWIPAQLDLRDWLREAEQFGYRFGPPGRTAASPTRNLLVRLGVTAAAAVQVMMVSLGFYLGLAPTDGLVYTVLGWVSLALATVALMVGGSVFLRSAWLGLRRGLAHLDLPIAVGIALAYGGSVAAFLRHGPEAAYFDSVSVFIALMLAGRWLQEHVLERNRNTLLADTGIDGMMTRRVSEEGVEIINAASIRRGDLLHVVPGEWAPVDGRAQSDGLLALDWITGESEAQAVNTGDAVVAGAFNGGRRVLALRADQDFSQSNLHHLLAATAEQGAGRERRWWDRVGRWYVGLVFVLAAVGFAVGLGGGLDQALRITTAVLVITCPCALGLAVPLAYELTLLGLRRRGVFVRRPRFLDRALRVRKLIFDKTGTLTSGALRLTPESAAALAGLSSKDRDVLLAMAAHSNHPVSRTLYAAGGAPVVEPAAALEETPGSGLRWWHGGADYRLGAEAFAAGDDGGSANTAFSRDEAVLARFQVEEDLKPDAAATIQDLAVAGAEVYLMSGDRRGKVAAAALRLGIPAAHCGAAMSPADKARWIGALDDQDTLMVGDGINDGPGFAAAYCSATPAVDHPAIPGKADFYFLGDGVRGVRAALASARRLRRVIRDNLIVAAAYNAVALTFCYLGLVGPLAAAVLMPVSSVAVVSLTTVRLRRGGD